MARAEILPDAVLNEVAEQIGTLLPSVYDPDRLGEALVEMGETFDVWVLDVDVVMQLTDDLSELAKPIGQWHHQVAIDGRVESFARSIPLGATSTSWRVVEVFASPLAGKINEAVDWIDQNVVVDSLVRLLIVPAYQVHAFWLLTDERTGQVFVIDRPEQFTRIPTNQLLNQEEFLEALRSEQHIIGRFRS